MLGSGILGSEGWVLEYWVRNLGFWKVGNGMLDSGILGSEILGSGMLGSEGWVLECEGFLCETVAELKLFGLRLK